MKSTLGNIFCNVTASLLVAEGTTNGTETDEKYSRTSTSGSCHREQSQPSRLSYSLTLKLRQPISVPNLMAAT